ncbi:kelch repeat-containing protein [Dermatobacter hominis]|uniref:kelch repeat-containing protein n=1 Tax=Dermatobacter hominis TaxID=2884263 RepID=UPI001D11EEDA|nr:kelch repeat-containing protein [Dermatobacter hominis]UDY36086.1 kelch motif-containing protein [Dermatobacter hominis]
MAAGLAVVAAGCSDSGTSVEAGAPEPAKSAISTRPPGTASAVAASDESLVVAGGFNVVGADATISADAWRWQKASKQWAALPQLPTNVLAVGAATVQGRLFVVGRDCNGFKDVGRPTEDCAKSVLLELVDDEGWTVTDIPTEVLDASFTLGNVGALDDRYLLVGPEGSPDISFVALDVREGRWSTVPQPKLAANTMLVGSCFTNGTFLGYANGTISSSAGRADTLTFVELHSDLEWSEPVSVRDIKFPQNNSAALCTNGALTTETNAGVSSIARSQDSGPPTVEQVPAPSAPVAGLEARGLSSLGVVGDQLVAASAAKGAAVQGIGPAPTGQVSLAVVSGSTGYLAYEGPPGELPSVETVEVPA